MMALGDTVVYFWVGNCVAGYWGQRIPESKAWDLVDVLTKAGVVARVGVLGQPPQGKPTSLELRRAGLL